MYFLKTAFALAALSLTASASTITGNSDTISGVFDSEPNGQHTVIQGTFEYNTPVNGTIVGFSDLTDFNIYMTNQYQFGWGIPNEPVSTYILDLADVETFYFDTSTDILETNVAVTPDGGFYGTLKIGQNPSTSLFGPSPLIGSFGNAEGDVDPTPNVTSTPEPASLLLIGAGLVGMSRLRRKR